MLRYGLLLSFTAVFLQIAVFLQPLLPQQYQIAPVCETITRALLMPTKHVHSEHVEHHQALLLEASEHSSHQHDTNHQCQYCTVYGNLVLPLDFGVQEVIDRIQIRLIAFDKAFKHVWFVLQQLFLMPQGRAPPQFA